MIKLKTKCNLNGNSYGLIINTDNKTFATGYGLVVGADVTTTRTAINDLIKALKDNHFKEI